jgi:hypothetical protein
LACVLGDTDELEPVALVLAVCVDVLDTVELWDGDGVDEREIDTLPDRDSDGAIELVVDLDPV